MIDLRVSGGGGGGASPNYVSVFKAEDSINMFKDSVNNTPNSRYDSS